MKIIPKEQTNIGELVAALKGGATIVYPTETCYGLGCDATNEAAVSRIFDIKHRQRDKSLLVIVSDVAMIREYVVWNEVMQRLSDQYWPGPLSMVADTVPGVSLPSGIVHRDGTMAFRVTNHPIAAALSEGLGGPIVSTSANISAEESPYDIERVLATFAGRMNQPDIVIDAGPLPHQLPSTIVKVVGKNVIVLRQGEIIVRT